MGVSLVGVIVLVAVLALATGAGLWWQRRNGRVRTVQSSTGHDGWGLAGTQPEPDDRVLLLQLSSPVCAPCARTREMLTALTVEHPHVRHVEIDVADRPDVARALGVLRTPTTVAFDRDGTELLRVGGVPRRAELIDALPVSEETR